MLNSVDFSVEHSVGPDLRLNCLQRLLADDKSHHWPGKSFKSLPDFLVFNALQSDVSP